MKVGDLVRSIHAEDLFGIIVDLPDPFGGWLVQWNNQGRSYELERHLEAVCK